MGKEGPVKKDSSRLAQLCLGIEKSKTIQACTNTPSTEGNADIKLRRDSSCRVRAVWGVPLLKIYTWMASCLLFGACRMASLRSNQHTSFPLCVESSQKWLYAY